MTEAPFEQVVTLPTLADGAAVELFQRELDAVLKNIQDPNTDAEAVRTITLKVAIKPNEERDMGACVISAMSKMAAVRPAPTMLYMGRHKGQLVAVETNPKQIPMFQDQTVARLAPAAAKEE